ncbi:hypothetical protein DPMN_110545 [Dreissena polymorpha]|uniref:Uncharacterized protein n=1 Tax=Dreissena polymorpha TaxID=45954 RepID=A0A9D4QP25_DREPO|nr:hypothetical protein DPMN_110545 [Dreissena polymorpha]
MLDDTLSLGRPSKASIAKRGCLPNIKKKGEYPVLSCRVALYTWINTGIYDYQSVFLSSSNVPSILSKIWLKRSTIPFPMGRYGVVLVFSTAAKRHNSLITCNSKLAP